MGEQSRSEVSIRRAREADLSQVKRLVEASYALYIERMGRRPAPMDADYAALISADNCWVADVDGRLLGALVLHIKSDHALVENVAVAPEAQGVGVGVRLLSFAENLATQAGVPEMRLYTNEKMTENLTYYPRRGYVEVDRREEGGFNRVFFVKSLAG